MRAWQGKRYWLVGASEGLGRALALQMSRMGTELVLSARSTDRLEALKAELPGQAQVVAVDVTDREAVLDAATQIGPVDGIVYLAGVCHWASPQDWDAVQADEMVEVNFAGAVRTVGAVLPQMVARNSGHIVLVGSLAAYRGVPRMGVYGATKAALMNMAESLRTDLRDTEVQVQIINPGFIRTRMVAPNTGKMPGILDPATAAREVFEAMNSDAFRLAFPGTAAFAARLGQFAPEWLYSRIMRRLG